MIERRTTRTILVTLLALLIFFLGIVAIESEIESLGLVAFAISVYLMTRAVKRY